jgi:thiamine-monophosphate kinase
MDIKDFGGEFALIAEMTRRFKAHHDVDLTVGDDCAVVPSGAGDLRVLTTDLLVEGEHFDRRWSTPRQIGIKTLEVNVSDVAAMGATPEFLLLNIALPKNTEAEFVLELYEAIREGCDRHGITLLGGDTSRGPVLFISATLTGRTQRPVYRSGARPGDLIAVTGDVGAAAAAVVSYRAGKTPVERVRLRHLEPRARTDVAQAIAGFATAMLDVSDGVASEVRHICEASGVGARVESALLPILADTHAVASGAGYSGLDCGLSGGEDFELLFALPPECVENLRQVAPDFTIIGTFLPAEQGLVVCDSNGHDEPLPAGYDHFT